MELTYFFGLIIGFILILLCSFAYLLYTTKQLYKLADMLFNIAKDTSISEELFSSDSKELSEYDIMREERERMFDNRINKMKNELANRTYLHSAKQRGTIAEELHPNVKNLPHYPLRNNIPDVEYAE